MILDDIRRAVAAVRADQARKKAIPGLPGARRLVICVGSWDAYCAARVHEAKTDDDLTIKGWSTFEGLPVEHCGGGVGVWCERRP